MEWSGGQHSRRGSGSGNRELGELKQCLVVPWHMAHRRLENFPGRVLQKWWSLKRAGIQLRKQVGEVGREPANVEEGVAKDVTFLKAWEGKSNSRSAEQSRDECARACRHRGWRWYSDTRTLKNGCRGFCLFVFRYQVQDDFVVK